MTTARLHREILAVLLALSLFVPLIGTGLPTAGVAAHAAGQPQDIYFDDTAPDHMLLGNDSLEVSMSKSNGAILTLRDKAANTVLTDLGSRSGCLWGSVYNTAPTYVGGCSYSATWTNRFSYAWDAAAATLHLLYTGDRSLGHYVDAEVTVAAAAGPFLDWRLTLSNQWGATLVNALLPSDLLFRASAVQAGYGPFVLPGAELKPAFFTAFLPDAANCGHQPPCQYVPTYPSDAAFADYLALDVAGGHLAVYTVSPDGPVHPVALGFVDNTPTQADSFFSYHSFFAWVPSGGAYSSPTVRMRIGQVPQDSILAYRAENGIAAYPAVTSKLQGRFAAVAPAPLIKADIAQINLPFLAWARELDRLPSPALLHPVAYQPGGHDTSYPDFLPPDPRWGTTADFRTMVSAAQARNLLVMPYINPTWWVTGSPTLQNLPPPLTVADLSVQDTSRQPVTETYSQHLGYVVSPLAPFVQQRLGQLLRQWRMDVPVDFVFEDQVGARVWKVDLNPASPNPLAYSDGWLTHTHTYAGQGLMTEMGWDRLGQDLIGFHGSLLTWSREFHYADQHWGAGNWAPYPLALWLLHDKVLFYQHDLSEYTMLPLRPDQTVADANELLTWNAAFGTLFSYHWVDDATLASPWLDVIRTLQQTLAVRYAGSLFGDYGSLGGNVTRSTFGNLTVVANWDRGTAYATDGHRVAPQGFYATTSDGSLLAGAFVDVFNGNPLTAGDHYLVVERSPTSVTVRQPGSPDTVLVIDLPSGGPSGGVPQMWALDRAGQSLGRVPLTPSGSRVAFTYASTQGGQRVDAYLLASAPCAVAFDDVPPAQPFYAYVEWLACRGAISGYADGTFRPGATVTRGQLVKMVVNAAGWTLANPPSPSFVDVPSSDPFYAYIETAVQHGVISGYTCGNPGEPCPGAYFRPAAAITRGQLAKVIALAEAYPLPAPGAPTFQDVPATNPFFPYVEAVAAHNVVSGYSCGGPGEPCPGRYFRPSGNATRGQVAKFITVASEGP